MLDFPEQNGSAPPPTVYSENLTGALYLDKASEIEAYSVVWDAIYDAALSEQDTDELLKEYLKEDPAGPALLFTRAEWTAFVGGVRAGEFDA